MKEKQYTSSPLCQLNGGCMGCCGHDFESKENIKLAIKKNTNEFQKQNPKTKQDFKDFKDREYAYNLRNGVCRNLIQKDCQIFCPLHPTKQEDKSSDLREGHCDIHHLCKTAKSFENWTKETQNNFLIFLKSKELDNISYSMKMDNNTLLEEFENTSYVKDVWGASIAEKEQFRQNNTKRPERGTSERGEEPIQPRPHRTQ